MAHTTGFGMALTGSRRLWRVGIRALATALLCAALLLSTSGRSAGQTSGSLISQTTWGACPGSDYADAVAVAPDGSLFVAGRTRNFTSPPDSENAFIFKRSPNGGVPWQKVWGGPDQDYATSVALGPDGDVYVAGETLIPYHFLLSQG